MADDVQNDRVETSPIRMRGWIGISLVFVTLGVLGAHTPGIERRPPEEFYADIRLIYATIVITSLVLMVVPRKWIIVVVLCLTFLLYQFLEVGLSLPVYPLVFTLFGSVFLSALFDPDDQSVVVGVLFLAIVIFGFNPDTAYGQATPRFAVRTMVVAVLPAALLVGFLRAFTALRRRLEAKRAELSELESTVDRLVGANVGFQRYAHEIEARSKRDERNAITREIHDSVGYMISVCTVMTDAALQFLYTAPRKTEALLNRAREHADTAHSEIRRSLHALRSLDVATAYGIKNVLRIADAFSDATGVNVNVVLTNTRTSYGGVIDATVYRFVQAALANAFRHGKAEHVAITFFDHGDALQVVVRDDGRGVATVQEGIGFLGMRERLSQVLGELSYDTLQSGFRVCARIPIQPGARRV